MPEREYVPIDVAAALPALDYPGTPAAGSGVLDGERFWPGRDPGRLDGRGLVLAVGSNAAPAVLAGKLRRAGATGPVPMMRAEVDGIGVGHSAHVSLGGYVPAAPYLRAGITATWALWLTAGQRAAVDATEPNYVRVSLRATEHPVRLEVEVEHRVETFGVYASRWGVLGTDGVPLSLMSQSELHARIADVAGPESWRAVEAAVRAPADPTERRRARQAFRDAGWVVDSGLVTAGREGPG